MKTRFLALTAVVALLCSCADEVRIPLAGYTEQKTYTAVDYSELNVHQDIQVVVCDTAQAIYVSADANMLPYLKVSLSGNELDLNYPGLIISHNSSTHIVVPAPTHLEKLKASGASSIDVEPVLNSRRLEVSASGSSSISAQVDCRETELHISGSSTALVTGITDRLDAHISGSSQLSMPKQNGRFLLDALDVNGSISGASSMCVHCDGTLHCSLSGDSRLYHTGEATDWNCSTSGSSRIYWE